MPSHFRTIETGYTGQNMSFSAFPSAALPLLILVFLGTDSCRPAMEKDSGDSSESFASGSEEVKILAVVGSSDLVVWDSIQGEIFIERSGLDFLPLPGNFAVLQAPMLEKNAQQKYLPVLVLGKPLEVDARVQVEIFAVFLYVLEGTRQEVLLAMPADPSLRTFDPGSFNNFITKYDPVRNILQQWLLYYKPARDVRTIGWRDKSYAGQIIANLKNREVEDSAPPE